MNKNICFLYMPTNVNTNTNVKPKAKQSRNQIVFKKALKTLKRIKKNKNKNKKGGSPTTPKAFDLYYPKHSYLEQY